LGARKNSDIRRVEMGGRCGELIATDDCVLVVIDVQGKLLAVMNEREKILDNAIKLARFAKVVGMPVLVTEQEKLGPTAEELDAELGEHSPIMKLDFDACRVEKFTEALEQLCRSTVVICGIESHICVTQTVLSLLPRYNVHVVRDAVGSRTRENLKVALDRMSDSGAVITSTEMVMYELLQRAGTDEFREVLKLIK
jgi:nicotinamidase-related amidase